jgi:hypothetical protein
MKSIFWFSLFFLSFRAFSQIPNPSFENWQTVQNCLKPVGWHSFYSEVDSSGTYCPIERSADNFPPGPGGFSLKISNDTSVWNTGIQPASWLGWGILFSAHLNDKPLFPVETHPKFFCGYYKFLPQNGDTLNFKAYLYNNGQEISMAHFRTDVAASEWTPFRVVFADTNYAAVDSGRITLSAANEPKDGSKGPLGNSVVFVDNISFDNLITERQGFNKQAGLGIFPNPASDEFVMERPNEQIGKEALVILSDIAGKEIRRVLWPSQKNEFIFRTTGIASGTYMLQYSDGIQKIKRQIQLME